MRLAQKKMEIDVNYFDSKEKQAFSTLIDSYVQFDKDYASRIISIDGALNNLVCEIRDKTVVIYGAGFHGANIQYLLRNRGIEIAAWADNDEDKQKTRLNGVMVLSPKQCVAQYPGCVWLVANYHVAEDMKKDLLQNHNIGVDQIIVCDAERLRERLM